MSIAQHMIVLPRKRDLTQQCFAEVTDKRMVVKELLDGMLLDHQARRLAGAPA